MVRLGSVYDVYASEAKFTMQQDLDMKMEEKPEVRGPTVSPLIASFYNRMTEEQWTMLRTGQLDHSLKDVIEDLMFDITISLANSLLEAFTNGEVTKERVKSILGDTLLQRSSEEPEEIPDVSVPTCRPQTDNFFTRMTVEQWAMLRAGQRDRALTVMIVNVIREIATTLSDTFLIALKYREVTEEHVKSCLGSLLFQMFSEALEIRSPRNITRPSRLSTIFGGAAKMFKSFNALRQNKVSQSPKNSQKELKIMDLAKEDTCEDFETEELEPETLAEDPTEDSFLTEMTEDVQEIISEEASKIIKCLTDDLSELGYDYLESGDTLEIKVISEQIAQSIHEEMKSVAAIFSSSLYHHY